MDNPDLPLSTVRLFQPSLWGRGPLARSRWLSPLYVQRYAGPRMRPQRTAHDYWELTYVFKGHGVLSCPQHDYALVPGSAVLLPPRLEHAERAEAGLDTLWVGLRGEALRRVKQPVAVAAGAELAATAEVLWLRALRPFGQIGAELDGLALALLGRFQRLALDNQRELDQLVERIIAHLQQHFAAPQSVAALAARFGCSAGYLHRSFKLRTGRSPVQYLTELRLEQAVRLLRHSTLSISKIAQRVGYRDPLYFSRQFRKRYRCPPSAQSARLVAKRLAP